MKKHRARRLLAFLLTVVMVLSLTPSALALDGGAGGSGVSWEKVGNGSVAAEVEKTAAEGLEEQPLYDDTDNVRVSIVLKDRPTLMMFSMNDLGAKNITESSAAMNYRAGLQSKQDAITQSISNQALGGAELDVVWNLTLAANIISANVKYGQIADIEEVPGVAEVVVETRYQPDVYSVGGDDPNMAVSTGMTGTTTAWSNGYTGAGMRVAIIDTGLDIEHQSFDNGAYLHALEENTDGDYDTYLEELDLLDEAELAGRLSELNVSSRNSSVTAADLYLTDKIAFAFNYVDGDLDVTHMHDAQGEHGSHVAGIAVANRYIPDGEGYVNALNSAHMAGNAPDAQVLVMKVFGKSGGAYDSDYMAAIEDAIILGCDSVNLSLGSGSAGMTTNATYQELLDGLSETNTLTVMSAGNSGYWAENDYNVGLPYSDEVNFQTSGSPGTYTNAMAVASVDNNGVIGYSFQAGDVSVFYTESSYSNEPMRTLDTTADGTGTTYDYVFVDGYGTADDFAGVDLAGKVVFCSRGETSFFEKANAAASAGAAATVVYNNEPGVINMDLTGYTYTAPCVSITQAEGAAIREQSAEQTTAEGTTYYTGTMTIFNMPAISAPDSEYLTMSSFSSWGAPGDLSIKPEITAPGGNIYSLNGAHSGDMAHNSHSAYELMSGTSMAAPQVAGIGALVKQSIEKRGLSQSGLTDRALATSLMMSTAVPLRSGVDTYYSILQQGAGLVDTAAATSADSYILVDGQADGKVKVELGDDPDRTGVYTFSFSIHNLDGQAHSYTLGAEVFTQMLVSDGNDWYLSTDTMPLAAATTFAAGGIDAAQVTVPANGSVTMEAAIHLDEAAVAQLLESCPNGFYVEAFVKIDGSSTAEGVEGTSHSIPVLGFYGNWTDPSMFDVGSYVEYAYGLEERTSHLGALVQVNPTSIQTNMFTMRYAGDSTEYLFAGNPLLRDATYLPERNALNNQNGDALYRLYFTAIRNAGAARLTVRGVGEDSGIAPYEADLGAVTAAYFHSNAGTWQNTRSSVTLNWAGTDGNGDPLPEGSTVEIGLTLAPELYVDDATGAVDWDALGDGASLTTQVTIDNTAPELLSADVEDGALLVSVRDKEYVAAVALFDATGTRALAVETPNQTESGAVSSLSLDLTGVAGKAFLLQASDYAGNLSTYRVTYEEELTPDIVSYYAAFNQLDQKWYGMDSESGASAVISVAAQDIYAAESVGNYVFAFDNVGNQTVNFYAMPANDPGDVTLVATMENPSASGDDFYVKDMAYNYADQTMYFLYHVDDENSYLPWLATVDLYTGETQTIGRLGEEINGLAIDSQGNFYGIVAKDARDYDYYLYTYTVDGYTAPVQVGEAPVVSGVTIPGWVSLAWDAARGTVVFADSQEQSRTLREIDPDTAEMTVLLEEMPGIMRGLYVRQTVYDFDADGDQDRDDAQALLDYVTGKRDNVNRLDLADLNWDGQVTSYDVYLLLRILESPGSFTGTDAPIGVTLSASQLELLVQESAQLTAMVTPWNLTDKSVKWSSSDEGVAQVTQSGVVTAVGKGTCTITAASAADESVFATCTVTASTIETTLYGTLQDAEGTPLFYQWNLDADSTWTEAGEIDVSSMTSATYDSQNQVLYLMDGANWNLHKVSMDGAVLESYGNPTGVPFWDMEYSQVFSTAEQPLISGVYGYYFLPVKNPEALDSSAFNLSLYLALYTEASYVTAITSLGATSLDTDEDGQAETEAEAFLILDNAGYIWEYDIYFNEGSYSAYLSYIPTTLPDLEFPGYGNDMYCSMTAEEEDGTLVLYLSYFNGETNEIYRMVLGEAGFEAQYIGNVGQDVWPATIYAATPNADLSAAAQLLPDTYLQADAVEVSAEELQGFLTEFPQRDGKPARGGASTQSAALTASGGRNSAGTAAGVNPSGSAALQATPSVGAINPGSRTVNVSITADSASNNGLLEIQFDPGVLDFNATSGASHLTSIVDNGDGTLTFGYASLEEIPAGSSLCVLTFHYQGSSLMTDLTVTTLEANDTNPNTSAEVDIQYQGAVTPPVNPGTEDPGEPEPPEQSGSESYTDLNPNAWYRQYADYVIEQGLMKGTSSTTFSPNEPLTRAMLVTILYRLEDMPSVTAGDRFSDVADATWYTDAVRWAADIGIVEGYGNGRFGPANPITRQELAVILWRYARYKGYDVGAAGAVLPDFADRGEIASWAGEAISWAYSRGIIIGKLDNVLDPRGGTTRIEAATMVTRFLWMDQD